MPPLLPLTQLRSKVGDGFRAALGRGLELALLSSQVLYSVELQSRVHRFIERKPPFR